MSRIEINAGGRQVIVDHTGELEPLQRTALALWEATAGPEPSQGPAVGFTAERRWSGEAHPVGNGTRYPSAPVTASSEGSGFPGPTATEVHGE